MAKTNSYGIKEVADVKFYPLSDDSNDKILINVAKASSEGGEPTVEVKKIQRQEDGTIKSPASPVAEAYTFDSLKVSNFEISSEDVSARGGKGNPELISWSYGKEVTFTMEDALLSMETLDLMFGAKENGKGNTLTIDANTFADYYTITGVTVMRSYATGKDEPFIFVIPKAKIQTNGSLTMEAEGDPSTLELTVKAMAAQIDDGKEKGLSGDSAAAHLTDDVLVKFYKPGNYKA